MLIKLVFVTCQLKHNFETYFVTKMGFVCCSQWPDPAYRVAPPQLPLDSVIEDDERLMFDMDQHLRHCHCDCGHDGYEGSLRHKVSTKKKTNNYMLKFFFTSALFQTAKLYLKDLKQKSELVKYILVKISVKY